MLNRFAEQPDPLQEPAMILTTMIPPGPVKEPICRFMMDDRGSLLLVNWVFLTIILLLAVVPYSVSLRRQWDQASVDDTQCVVDR
jgi:hypothetical protein